MQSKLLFDWSRAAWIFNVVGNFAKPRRTLQEARGHGAFSSSEQEGAPRSGCEDLGPA